MPNQTTIVGEVISTEIQPPAQITVELGAEQGPSGVGYSPAVLTATEALTAGNFVNITSSGVRKASSANYSRVAHGFVLASVASGAQVTVHFGGINTALAGLTVGPLWLGANGGVVSTPLVAGPGMVQPVGFASSATAINFQPGLPVVLAGTPA